MNKFKIVALLIMNLTIINCSFNKHIYLNNEPDLLKNQLDSICIKKSLVLHTNQGRKFNGNIKEINIDSIYFENNNNEKILFKITDISKIEATNKVAGTFQGLGIGVATGAILGFTIGYASAPDCSNVSGWCFDKEQVGAMSAMMLGILGGIIGIPVGAIKGSKTYYHFHCDSTCNQTQMETTIEEN